MRVILTPAEGQRDSQPWRRGNDQRHGHEPIADPARDAHESLAERPIPRNDAGLRGWKPRAVIPALLRSGFRSDTSPPSGLCPGTVVARGERLPHQPLALIGVTDVPDRDRSGAAANVL